MCARLSLGAYDLGSAFSIGVGCDEVCVGFSLEYRGLVYGKLGKRVQSFGLSGDGMDCVGFTGSLEDKVCGTGFRV